MNISKQIQQRLAKVVKAKGVRVVARETGLDPSIVSKIARGDLEPSRTAIDKLGKYLGGKIVWK